ncbi:Uncharacterised protein [Bordetella pertussis]|nr:Uncharacterised protein [Bordetella pertussis]
MGSTVGVKYAMRRKPRPCSLPLTHSAMASAMAIEVGIVPSANHRLFHSDCQNTGSSRSSA